MHSSVSTPSATLSLQCKATTLGGGGGADSLLGGGGADSWATTMALAS